MLVGLLSLISHFKFKSKLNKPGFELFMDFSNDPCLCRGNIPGAAVQAGEELCHYLPPFPARGTGFHRYIYVLFKQDGPINFQENIRPSPW